MSEKDSSKDALGSSIGLAAMFFRYDDSGESPMGRLVGCVDYLR